MPTVAEMQLLNHSLDELANTLYKNRVLAQQGQQEDRRNELERAMLGIRSQESARGAAHEKRLEDYQKELLAATKEGNADRRSQELFRIMGEMGRNGMLTDEAVNAMSDRFNQQFNPAGVGVKLFKLPPTTKSEPGAWTNPKTGREYTVFGNTILDAQRGTGGRVTYKPNPEDPEGPMIPTITHDLNQKEIEALIAGRAGGNAAAANQNDPLHQRLKQIDVEIAQHQVALAQGHPSTGLGSLNPFGNWPGSGRQQAIDSLNQEKARIQAALGANPTPSTPATPPAATNPAAPPAPAPAPAAAAAPTPRVMPASPGAFDSEEQARAAGKTSGDVIQLWDPNQRRFRPYQLE